MRSQSVEGRRFIDTSYSQAPVHKYWQLILEDYIMTAKFDISLILTHRFKIEDLAKLYAKFDKRVEGLLKCFVETRFSDPPKAGYPRLTRVDDLPDA